MTTNQEMQHFLDEAHNELLCGNLDVFVEKLVLLLTCHITCNCFLRNQKDELWQSMLNVADSLSDDNSNFNLNLAKGFIYERNSKEELAFKYLSIAIGLKPNSDIAYSLRAAIEKSINGHKKEDATQATLLNPSARNYFILGNLCDEAEANEAIIYYEKAIHLEENFPCAYNNKAGCHEKLKDYARAIENYLHCISLQPDHWCYYHLWYCLDELGEYQKALKFIEIGFTYHSGTYSYLFALGVANARVSNYEKAIEFYNKYLQHKPTNETALKNLEISKRKFHEYLLKQAEIEFSSKNYLRAVESFEKYLAINDTKLDSASLKIYLKAKVCQFRPETRFDEFNSHRVRLVCLKESFWKKKFAREELSEDEININKLMVYQSRYKIGFGDYEGQAIQDIIAKDAQYILWCVINLYHFSISPSLFLLDDIRAEADYINALEINIIKCELIDQWHEEEYVEEEEDDVYDDYEDRHTYDNYGGSYAQDVEGWSDQDIDDVLDGNPDAYWNID